MKKMTKDKKRNFLADLSLLMVALIWGGGFIAVKDALNSISPFYMMAIRFSLATIMMLLVFFKKIKILKRKDLVIGSIVGLFLFAGFAVQTIGMKYTSAGKNAFLTATNVVIVPFLSWIIYKKKPDGYSIAAAFLTLVGIAFLSLQNGFAIGIGDSLTLLCAVFFAVHIVLVGYFAKDNDPIILTMVQLGLSAVLSLVAALFFEKAPTGLGFDAYRAIGYLGFFSTFIAFLIQNVAQKYSQPTHAAIILCLESVFGSVFAVLLLHDVFTIKMIIGCVLIFFAIILSETKLDFSKKLQIKDISQ